MWLPMKPAPPVTTAMGAVLLPAGMDSGARPFARLELSNARYYKIIFRRGPPVGTTWSGGHMKRQDSIVDVVATIREKARRARKVVFVSGNFNVLHPGHLRLL